MRSPLTMRVFPTRAHSARICRTVASFATIVTRPLRINSWTSARAAGAKASHAETATATVRSADRILKAFSRSIDLLPAEIVDDLGQDVVERMHRLIADHLGGFRQVRDAARHVFETGLVRLVI